MVQIKHFTAPQKMPNFQLSRRAKWTWRDKILGAPQRGQKIIVNQSKPILVIVSIKAFTRVSGKIIFLAKLSGRFLLRQPLKELGIGGRICSKQDSLMPRMWKFCSRNSLTLVLNEWHARSRRTQWTVAKVFSNGCSTSWRLIIALIWVRGVGFLVIVKEKNAPTLWRERIIANK